MNRMIGCGDALTSAMTDLSRFSNSPLTPAPACSRPRSSVRTTTFFERRRHVAGDDAQGEAFDDGRLADARLAGQDRVVLPAAREDVDDLANLEVAADDRIDLALLGALGEVHGELIERRRLAAGRGAARRRAGAGGIVRRRRTDLHSCRARSCGQVRDELLGRDLLQARAVVVQTRRDRLGSRQQGRQEMPGANAARLVVERGHHPGFAQPVEDVDRQLRRPRVAGLELVEGSASARGRRRPNRRRIA